MSCLEAETLEQAMDIAAGIGYRHVEFGALPDDTRPNVATISEEARRRVLDRASELELHVSAIQCHLHNGYADADPAVRQAAVDHTRHMIDLCTRFDIPLCHTVSGVAPDQAPRQAKLDRLAAAYTAILDHAAGGPVAVGIEPVFVYVIGNAAHLESLLARLDGRPDLTVNYDPSHFSYHDEDPNVFARTFADRIVHAHSKDALVRPLGSGLETDEKNLFAMPGDRCFCFAAPGQGLLDWDTAVATLCDIGFDGVLSLEMGHGYEGPPNRIAADVYRFFRDRFDIS